MELTQILAAELSQPLPYVENVVRLLDEGNTIPFIARYRKELHGAMDDTTLRDAGRAAALSAQFAGAARRGKAGHRKPGQADGGAVRRHRCRHHAVRGGGPVPPL